MYVRFTIINGDPAKIDSSVEYLELPARPQVEATAGNKGFVTLPGIDARITIAASYWEDAEALEASGTALAPLREQVQAAAGGPPSVEEYEVALGFRQATRPGAPSSGFRGWRTSAPPTTSAHGPGVARPGHRTGRRPLLRHRALQHGPHVGADRLNHAQAAPDRRRKRHSGLSGGT